MADPVLTVYSQIVALLKAEPTLYDPAAKAPGLVWPGNFISFEGAPPRPGKQGRPADADFPQLVLDDGNFSDTGFTQWPTFATFGSGTPRAWKEQFVQQFVLTLTLRDWRVGPAYQLRDAIALALRVRGGPRLQQPTLVKSWGPLASTSRRLNNEQTGGTERRVLTINLPVTFQFDGQSIPS